jgi:hypothetical protein
MAETTKYPLPYEGAPTTTKVLGYVNSNAFPVLVHAPELNRSVTLQPKKYLEMTIEEVVGGKTVKTQVKINDPIFENYVGQAKLTRVEGKELVPITWLVRPALQPIPTSAFEFAGSQKFKTDRDGKVVDPGGQLREQAAAHVNPAGNSSAVTGYANVSDAVKARVMKPAGKVLEDHEVVGKKAQPHVRPMRPSEFLAGQKPKHNQIPRPQPTALAAPSAEQEAETGAAEEGDTDALTPVSMIGADDDVPVAPLPVGTKAPGGDLKLPQPNLELEAQDKQKSTDVAKGPAASAPAAALSTTVQAPAARRRR